MVVLEVLSAPEFLHHNHLILAHLWRDLKQLILLRLLCQINNVCPTLLIFRFEIPQELIERFIFLCHSSDAVIERLAFLCLLALHKSLQLLNLMDSPGPS